MARVLLTGSHGFIGRHVHRHLVAAGHAVIPFDRAADPAQDICDPAAVRAALAGAEAVVHLASAVGVDFCYAHPEQVRQVVWGGTANILAAAAEQGIRRLVFASSSEVYGEGAPGRLTEDAPKAPISTYGQCKLAAEELCRRWAAEYGISVSMLRYCNVYGPGQRPDFVVARFLQQALAGQPLTIYGDGGQVRCYTYVADAAAATVRALDLAAGVEAFNIAHPAPVTVRELAEAVAAQVPGVQTQPIPLGEGIRTAAQEVFRRVPDSAKAQRLLRWQAQVDLAAGLAQTLQARQDPTPGRRDR